MCEINSRLDRIGYKVRGGCTGKDVDLFRFWIRFALAFRSKLEQVK
jgi:hypothetical protein